MGQSETGKRSHLMIVKSLIGHICLILLQSLLVRRKLLFVLLTIILGRMHLCIQDIHDQSHEPFPKSIPVYLIRKDKSQTEVSRGRFEAIGGIPTPRNDRILPADSIPLTNSTYLKRVLQCANFEPSIDGESGILSLLKLARPTKVTLQSVCAWLETSCSPWNACHTIVSQFANETYPPKLDGLVQRHDLRLLRIMKGKLYIDWPWGTTRFTEKTNLRIGQLAIIHYALKMISDIPDSVFLHGGQQSYLPRPIPFPAFSCSPSFKSSELVMPWTESFISALYTYRLMKESKNFSAAAMNELATHVPFKSHPQSYLPWERRIPKAAAAMGLLPSRQIFFDQLAQRPDLFHGHWSSGGRSALPWNPASTEGAFHKDLSEEAKKAFNNTQAGFVGSILSSYDPKASRIDVGRYKYLVVTTGGFNSDDLAALTGKLAAYMSHSGAVIMLQRSEFLYHFSARLKPWVHYVPLSYSMAELTRKVEYLKANDHLAKRLAMNARAFADSYLRLEDYFCYTLAALEGLQYWRDGCEILKKNESSLIFSGLGQVLNGSDVLIPNNATLIPAFVEG